MTPSAIVDAAMRGMTRHPVSAAWHPVIQRLHALDEALVAQGFPATTRWWYATLERFYASGRRQLVVRAGRRAGKSSTLCRLAACEALWGQHQIPPGDTGVVAIISTDRKEAGKRLVTIKAILDALGEPYRPIEGGGGIQLTRKAVQFAVYTASVSGVSGFTSVFVFCDEVAKWRDADTGANPARQVLASVRPTMAGQPHARIFLSSSPFGHLDAHANAYDAGDDDFQLCAWASTWIARPGLTEAETHLLEKNEDVWRREYAAIPMEGDECSMLSAALLDAATRELTGDLPREPGVQYVAAMDPGFVQNPWTFAIAAKRWVQTPKGARLKRSVVAHREWRGSALRPNDPEAVMSAIATICRVYGVEVVESDQYERFGLQSIANRPEVQLVVRLPGGGAGANLARYEALVTQFSDGEIDIPPDRQVRADLLAIRQRLTPNGFTIALPQTPDGRHADYAPTLALALAACVGEPVVARFEPTPGSTEWENAWLDREFAAAKRAKNPSNRLILNELPRPKRRLG